MDLSHDQQSASDSMPKNAVVYANIDVNTGIQPSTSFKQSASTAVDVSLTLSRPKTVFACAIVSGF